MISRARIRILPRSNALPIAARSTLRRTPEARMLLWLLWCNCTFICLTRGTSGLEPPGTARNHPGIAHSCPAGRIPRLLYVQPYYRIEIHNATHDDTLVFDAGAADECQCFCVVAPWTDLQGVRGIQASLRMSSKAPSKYTKTAYDTRPY